MATLNEDDRKKSPLSDSEITDIETLDSSDEAELEEYGVWVKSGPEDIAEAGSDEEFEISDLAGTADEDLLTDEEEELLSDLEDQIHTGSSLLESDSSIESETLDMELPDFNAQDSNADPIEEIGSFDLDIPEEEPAIGPALDPEAKILEDLPDIDIAPDLESEPLIDEIGLSSGSSGESTPEEFMEISLDAFGDSPADEESTTLEGAAKAEESTVEDDFLDLDFDDDEEASGGADSLFTTEELDDFFGVPIEDMAGSEASADDAGTHDASYFDGIPSSHSEEAVSEPAGDVTELEEVELESMDFDDAEPIETNPVDSAAANGEELPELEVEALEFTQETNLEDPVLEDIDAQPAEDAIDSFDESIFETGEADLQDSTVLEEGPENSLESVDAGIERVEASIESARGNESLETSILLQIERELASIKSELSDLKQELSSLRQGVGKSADQETESETVSTEKASGFFDETEDETIALTGDELDNILNTADITEETGEEENVSDNMLSLSEGIPEEEMFTPSDEDLIPLDEPGTKPAVPVRESVDEQVAGEDEEEIQDEGISLVEASEASSDIDSFFDEQPESLTMTEDEEETLPVFEEVSEVPEEILEEPSIEFEEPIDEETIVLEESETGETSVFIPEEIEPDPEETAFDETPVAEEEPKETQLLDVEDDIFSQSEEVMAADEAPVSQTIDSAEPSDEDLTLSPSTEENGLNGSLREEIKSVLSYMDSLLEALPESKIEEFARSEHFDVYRKLFEELGLGK